MLIVLFALLLAWPARAEDDLTQKQLNMLAAEAQFFSAAATKLRDQLTAEHKYWQEWCEGEYTCDPLPSTKPGESK